MMKTDIVHIVCSLYLVLLIFTSCAAGADTSRNNSVMQRMQAARIGALTDSIRSIADVRMLNIIHRQE